MEYTCSVCQEHIVGDVVALRDHTDKHVIDLIKHDHPEWVESDGICPRCEEYYRGEIEGSTFKDAPCAIRHRKVKNFAGWIKGIFKK